MQATHVVVAMHGMGLMHTGMSQDQGEQTLHWNLQMPAETLEMLDEVKLHVFGLGGWFYMALSDKHGGHGERIQDMQKTK